VWRANRGGLISAELHRYLSLRLKRMSRTLMASLREDGVVLSSEEVRSAAVSCEMMHWFLHCNELGCT
jgi:hypothetical protein